MKLTNVPNIMVAVHGRPSDSGCLKSISDWCTDLGVPFHTYDQYGSGTSPASRAIPHDKLLDHFVQELTTFIDSIEGDSRVVIWAHSVGALFAAKSFSQIRPGRITAAIFSGFCPFRAEFCNYVDALSLALEKPEDFAGKHICRLKPWPPYFKNSMANRPYGDLDLNGDHSQCLRQIDVPVLLLRGEYDICSAEQVRLVQNEILGAKALCIPGASHYPFIENPTATFAGVADFLDNNL